MAAKKTVDILDTKRKPYMTIFMLAWPVFVEQIFTTLVSFVDTAMVGSLGKEATASISISSSPRMMFVGVVTALGIGITAGVARAAGAGDEAQVRKLLRHALLIGLYVGTPIALLVAALSRLLPVWMGAEPAILDTAAQYNLIESLGRIFSFMAICLHAAFRGYGDTKSPMKANLILNAVNVAGNFLLIYPTRTLTVLGVSFVMPGAGWGVTGAAIATAAGFFASGMVALRNAFKKSNPYRISLKERGWFKPDWTVGREIFKIGLPAMLERLCLAPADILTSSSIATLGTASVAARSLCGTAESLSYMPAFAFQTAITTLVGQSYGARKPALADHFVRVCLRVGGTVMFFTGLALFVFAEQIIGVFTPDGEVIAMAAACLRIEAVIQVPQVIGWIYAGALRGVGNTKAGFYFNAITSWGIRTPGIILAIRLFGTTLPVAYRVVALEISARMVLFFLCYRNYRRDIEAHEAGYGAKAKHAI